MRSIRAIRSSSRRLTPWTSLHSTNIASRYPLTSALTRGVSSTPSKSSSETVLQRPIDSAVLFGKKFDLSGPARTTGLSIQEEGSWSSPHDVVSRNAFTKDHARLWTLLEAAIASGEFARGEKILLGLVALASEADITLAVNNFLLELVSANPTDPLVAREWLAEISDKIPAFEPNSITEAALLKNLFTADKIDEMREFIYEYRQTSGSLRQLLGHVDILGLKALQTIVAECNVSLREINEKYRNAIELSLRSNESASPTTETASTEIDQNETQKFASERPHEPLTLDESLDIPTLEKGGVETVTPMKTLGIQAIRHTLRGLRNADQIKETIAPHLQGKSIDSENYVDFLSIFEQLSPEEAPAFEEFMDELNRKRQQEIEARGYEGAREKWRKDFERQRQSKESMNDPGKYRKLDTLLWEWNEAMLPLVKEEIKRVKEVLKYSTPSKVPSHLREEGSIKNVTVSDRFEYGPYLLLVNPENLPAITMIELLNLNSTGGINEGMRSSKAVLAVGKTVEDEFRRTLAKKREREALKGFNFKAQTTSEEKVLDGTLGEVKSAVTNSDLNTKHSSWPAQVCAKVGSLLISMLLQVARVNVKGKDPVTGMEVEGKAPAFFHSYQYHAGNKLGVLKLHRNLSKYLTGEIAATAIPPQMLPMLVKPRPWTAYNKGGYLYSNARVMRSRDSPEQIAYLRTASSRGQLDDVFKGLNVLGDTAWTINKDLFEIILKVWNTGKGFLDVPQAVTVDVDLPPAPPRDVDPTVRRDWLRQCRNIVNENQSLFSQRCDSNYKLEIARAFLGERFYFPHNVDFRGRAYPLSPHLNHLGNDMARSLLKFWEGRELGERGLRWLKIHIANVYGHSKMSFDDRCKFVDDNIDAILESANDPLGKDLEEARFWKEAESPWQFLAACIELRNAMKLDDPTKYVSRIPVHQDGTCNGLQHYAALGGDVDGAEEVNLLPNNKPQDVYTRVLHIVEKIVEKEAKQGKEEAVLLHNRLSRRIVKQTVMTNVYGVTFVGARQQIANKLKDFEDLDRDKVFKLATYLAHKVLYAVRSLFYSAHLIQDWLGDNATLISRSVRLDVNEDAKKDRRVKRTQKPNHMSSVIWTTPLGLPCVQPYREEKKKQVVTSIQSVFISDPYAMRGVNARKQKTAFPPNYIHSLDATHMLMSAIGCGEQGVNFAAVHDSYWTHAGDVDKMNAILRDCFIRLHEVDLVEKLRDEFSKRYEGLLHLVHIPRDCELAEQISRIKQKYAEEIAIREVKSFKPLTVQDQLNIERQRRQLLSSSDESEVNKGEMMVTPVSIVEDVPEQELEALVQRANEVAAAAKAKARKQGSVKRSSEFEGRGLESSSLLDVEEAREEEVAERAMEEEAEDEASGNAIEERPNHATMATGASIAGGSITKQLSGTLMPILVPLRIPKVPPKGEFDVQQLRDSQYFFS
ncbi:DNA-directed RNA polymerase, mitochondrial [Trichomonascus vanleenenianus]|uniref:DNA-directed RNA polymerase n=1 Tax=Trichomonascus vanleenenianus TaxID=2268995 RepID=UPI003ECB895E